MPKKPKDNSHESTLGGFAKAVGEIPDDKPSADQPTEAEPVEPGSGGDSAPASKSEAGKGQAPPEGDAPQGL
jgi:hypothetical protein